MKNKVRLFPNMTELNKWLDTIDFSTQSSNPIKSILKDGTGYSVWYMYMPTTPTPTPTPTSSGFDTAGYDNTGYEV